MSFFVSLAVTVSAQLSGSKMSLLQLLADHPATRFHSQPSSDDTVDTKLERTKKRISTPDTGTVLLTVTVQSVRPGLSVCRGIFAATRHPAKRPLGSQI